MAPPMKELPRWLLDNPEFSVAPDWTDIVKQSVSNLGNTSKEIHFFFLNKELFLPKTPHLGFSPRSHV